VIIKIKKCKNNKKDWKESNILLPPSCKIPFILIIYFRSEEDREKLKNNYQEEIKILEEKRNIESEIYITKIKNLNE